MARSTYNYRKRHKKRLKRYGQILLLATIATLVVGGFIVLDTLLNQSREASTPGQTVIQTSNVDVNRLRVDEPTFKMQLPGDWEEVERINLSNQTGITWQATNQKEFGRYLTLYIDKIPPNVAVNRVVPVEANGDYLKLGNVSRQCQTFTPGGTNNLAQANKLQPKISKWEDIEFLCNLTNPLEYQIGTSSTDGINQVRVKGEDAGTHTYFFLYTDHTKSPNDQALIKALQTFQAK